MLAHVLTGSPIPAAVQWLLAAMLFGGALAAAALRTRGLRVAAGGAAVLGLLGTVACWVVAAAQPGAPPYTLRITSPAPGSTVPPSFVMTVCGVLGDGTTAPATDAQHWLVVFVDTRETVTVDSWRVAETLGPGPHTLRVVLVTPAHHAFSPTAQAQIDVVVSSAASLPSLPSC